MSRLLMLWARKPDDLGWAYTFYLCRVCGALYSPDVDADRP